MLPPEGGDFKTHKKKFPYKNLFEIPNNFFLSNPFFFFLNFFDRIWGDSIKLLSLNLLGLWYKAHSKVDRVKNQLIYSSSVPTYPTFIRLHVLRGMARTGWRLVADYTESHEHWAFFTYLPHATQGGEPIRNSIINQHVTCT